MSRSWARGSTPRWRKIRRGVLRDNQITNGGRCTIAIVGVCTGTATVVHHTLGRQITGDDLKYLAAACAACNLAIGAPEKNSPTPKPKSNW